MLSKFARKFHVGYRRWSTNLRFQNFDAHGSSTSLHLTTLTLCQLTVHLCPTEIIPNIPPQAAPQRQGTYPWPAFLDVVLPNSDQLGAAGLEKKQHNKITKWVPRELAFICAFLLKSPVDIRGLQSRLQMYSLQCSSSVSSVRPIAQEPDFKLPAQVQHRTSQNLGWCSGAWFPLNKHTFQQVCCM